MEISCTNENELYKISAPDKTKTKTNKKHYMESLDAKKACRLKK